MRNPVIVLALILSAAAMAGGIALDPAVTYIFTNCTSDAGHPAQTVAKNVYLVTVTDKDTTLCYGRGDGGADCIDGGMGGGTKLPLGAMFLLTVPSATAFSCYSSDGTGDINFTSAR